MTLQEKIEEWAREMDTFNAPRIVKTKLSTIKNITKAFNYGMEYAFDCVLDLLKECKIDKEL